MYTLGSWVSSKFLFSGKPSLSYALDTDDTFVPPPEPESCPVKRQLFVEPEEVHASPSPKKHASASEGAIGNDESTRPVARPLQALKDKLAAAAAEMRVAKAKKRKATASASCPSTPETKEKDLSDVAEAGIEEEAFTRREQLTMQPAPKAKGKAKAKAKAKGKAAGEPSAPETGEPKTAAKSKPAKKQVDAASIADGAEPVAGNEGLANDAADEQVVEKAATVAGRGGRGRGGRGRGRGRGSKAPDAVEDLPAEEASSSAKDAAAAGRKKARMLAEIMPNKVAAKRTRLVSTSKNYLTATEVMDILQNEDMKLRIVLDMLEAMRRVDCPLKEAPSGLPEFKFWGLSVYWTRNSIGMLRKRENGSSMHVGNLVSGGWHNISVALEAVSHFATRFGLICAHLMLP